MTARFALLPVAVVLLLTLALLALAQRLVVDELERRTLLRNQHRAAALAQQVEATLQAAVREARLLARSEALQNAASPAGAAAARAELEHLRSLSPHVVWLGLLAPDGVVRAGTQGWLEGRSLAERPVFLHGLRGSWVGDVHPALALASQLQAADGRPSELIDVAEPVRDTQGRVVAVLAAHLGVDWVDRLRRGATGEAEGAPVPGIGVHVLSTVAERGVLPGEAPPAGVPLRVVPPAEVVAADGQRYLAASREIGEIGLAGPAGPAARSTLPWRVLVLQERGAALAPAHAVMRTMALLGGGVALVAGLLGYVLARRMLSPWAPVFRTVLERLGHGSAGRVGDAELRAIAEELQRAPAGSGPEVLLARLARDARDLKRAIDQLPLGVALIDRHFQVEYLNAGYTRLLGWTTEQVRGRMAAEFLWDAAERPAFTRLFTQLSTPAGELVARFEALTPDGLRVPIQWHFVPLNDEDGRLEGALALVTDIRIERAQQARADAMAGRLRALADAAHADLLATLDHEGRVLEWSRGAERLSGHAASEAVGRALASLLPPADVVAWVRQALREGRCAVSAELLRADGHARWFEGSLYALGLAPGSARYGLVLRDVSDARAAQGALQRSEARLRLAVEAARMGTWDIELGEGTQRVTWSDGYGDLFGLAARQLPRNAVQTEALLHPQDRAPFRNAFRRTVRDDAPLQAEFRVMAPGGLRWHAVHGRALRGSDGRVTRLVGVGMDISERKQAEVELRAGRERIERLLATMAEGLLVIDADGRYAMANQAAERILGAPASAIVGRRFEEAPWRRFEPPGVRQAIDVAVFAGTLQGGGPVVDKIVGIETLAGQRRVLSVNATATSGGRDAGFDGVLVTFLDITERHQAEQSLADSEARLAAIVRGASDAIVSTDVGGLVTLFNPAAERIFGMPAGDMLGQSMARLLPEGERPAHEDHVAAFVASGVSQRNMGGRRVSARRADGRALELEATISRATVRGQLMLTAILRDVTERVGQERALEAARAELAQLARRLLEQEKETTRRLAQALHDEVGQTLTALRLQWDGLEAQGAAPAQCATFGALVAKANRQVRGVLGELRPPLLDEAGLVAALENEIGQLRGRDGGDAIDLRVPERLHGQRWPGDVEYAAFMIGREALVNAMQHARAGRIEACVEGDAGELVLTVADDGVGIDEPDGGARPGHLGLVGMRERALAIGATIAIDSASGRGTVVRVKWEPLDEPDLPRR